jgi:hypothetical protein
MAAGDGEFGWFQGSPSSGPGMSDRKRGRGSPLYYIALALLILLSLFLGVLVLGPGDAIGSVAVVLACTAVGGLVGFIFAIPKRVEAAASAGDSARPDASAGEAANRSSEPSSAYRPNTSLEEISDWLTKIIVGLGLVEASRIGDFLETEGTAVAPILFGAGAASVLGELALLAATILSFLSSFLYFRVCLPEEFSASDKRARDVNRKIQAAERQGRVQRITPKGQRQSINVLSLIASDPATPAERVDKPREGDAASKLEQAIKHKLKEMGHPRHPADPVKGLFGGKASIEAPHARVLSAKVKQLGGVAQWFQIDLKVTSADGGLKGDVVFFTHPTFPQPFERVKAVDGVATLQLFAYGAFTVGVLADDGETELELDLAGLNDAPRAFREN